MYAAYLKIRPGEPQDPPPVGGPAGGTRPLCFSRWVPA
jgi:hypothetical protein